LGEEKKKKGGVAIHGNQNVLGSILWAAVKKRKYRVQYEQKGRVLNK